MRILSILVLVSLFALGKYIDGWFDEYLGDFSFASMLGVEDKCISFVSNVKAKLTCYREHLSFFYTLSAYCMLIGFGVSLWIFYKNCWGSVAVFSVLLTFLFMFSLVGGSLNSIDTVFYFILLLCFLYRNRWKIYL